MTLLLRLFAYLYHAALSLMLLAIGLVAWLSDSHSLRLEMLPWTGETLTKYLLAGGLAGLLGVLLAMFGWFRALLPVWALVALVMMVRGYLMKPYAFRDQEHFYWILAAIGGALLAFLGSLTLFRQSKRR